MPSSYALQPLNVSQTLLRYSFEAMLIFTFVAGFGGIPQNVKGATFCQPSGSWITIIFCLSNMENPINGVAWPVKRTNAGIQSVRGGERVRASEDIGG